MNVVRTKDLREWKARLVHRKYLEWVDPSTAGHFSARIEQNGTGCYFPLGSADETEAAARALEIHRSVQAHGWNLACRRHRREFTLAVFWSANPLLGTYTTLLTWPGKTIAPVSCAAHRTHSLSLLIVEAHNEFRQALLHWAMQLPECARVNAVPSPSAARSQLNRQRADLVLFNRNLPEFQPGVAGDLPAVAPAAFAFGIYETSDDIFISHTGVSLGYFLQRTPPSQVLAPVAGAWGAGASTTDEVLRRTRKYFEDLISGPPSQRPAAEKTALTPREEEILLRLSKGYQDKQIADGLNISTWTVHNHIKKIFKKLSVHTRTQAVIKHLQK